LQAAFRIWSLAGLAIVTLPVAVAGGLLASLVDGTKISLGALAGLLAVFAIAARNMITLIDHYQRLEQLEGKSLGPDLVIQGSGERLTPILTTAFATGFALIPFLFLGNRAGLEIVHPMAVTILGGLVTSTLLSLFVVPALYLRVGSGSRPAMTPEDELMHRWAGAEPVATGERWEAAEPQVPAKTTPTGAGVVPPGEGAPPGSPIRGGADSGIQPGGEE
jgi:hypothetical protein